jgi:arylsulfatase A-like enzyme
MPETRRVFGSQGVTYSNAVVTTPLCCPSRASIFTGQYVHNHGVAINDGTLLDARNTWQSVLRSVGYRTGIIGKYLNGIPATSAPYFDYRQWLGLEDPNETRVARSYADEFLDAAEAEDSRPWALLVAVNSPHYPWTVMPEHPSDLGSFMPTPAFGEADLSDKHPAVERWSNVKGWYPNWFRTSRGPYLRELEATDEMIGGLFEDLGRHGEEHQTLAFFISDNGMMRGEHRLSSKIWPYLESVRVPFYARWPEHVASGSIDRRLAANIDIAPTIYDAAGLAPGYPVDGRSLLAPAQRSWFFLEYPQMAYSPPAPPPWSAYLTPTRHYIRWEDGFVEDYDLRSDPAEMTASNAVDPAIARLLDQAQSCVGSACP